MNISIIKKEIELLPAPVVCDPTCLVCVRVCVCACCCVSRSERRGEGLVVASQGRDLQRAGPISAGYKLLL